jgi:hypothetical protein
LGGEKFPAKLERIVFRSRKEMECALARFLRLGGDDDLQLVSPGAPAVTSPM